MQASTPLTSCKSRTPFTIVAIEGEDSLAEQLAEQGFREGETVEVTGRGIFGGSPLAVRIGRAVIALRRSEAEALMVVPS